MTYTLRAKILLTCMLAALLPVSLGLGVGLTLQWQTNERNAQQRLLAAAHETALRLDSFLVATQNAIRVEAQLPALVEYLSAPGDQPPDNLARRAKAVLDVLRRKDTAQIMSYALIDLSGVNRIDTATEHEGEIVTAQDYFTWPLTDGLPFVSPVRFVPAEAEASLDFSSPIQNAAGDRLGILRVRYSAVILQEIVFNDSGLGGDESFAILLDPHTIVLADGQDVARRYTTIASLDPAQRAALRADGRLPADSLESPPLPEFAAGLANAAQQPMFVAPLITTAGTSIQHQLAVSPVKSYPWQVVFAQPREAFLTPLIVQAQVLVGLAMVLMLGVAGVALWAARWLAGPIVRLTAVAAQVSRGDLTAQARVESRDEIGTLALTFNQMTAQMRELVQSLEERVVERQQTEEEIRHLNTVLEQRVRERTLELEAANKELEAFSYSISHDLRAPLRAMTGYASLLITEHSVGLNSEGRRYLSLIQTNARQMSQLLEALVLFVSLGRKPLRHERVQPAELARQALEALAPEQANRQVEVSIADLPPCQADPMLLKQVYFHLLSNALKFTRRRALARIEVGHQPDAATGRVVYFVRDNGVGFDMQYAHKLFGVFQRLHSPEEYEGPGAGLAIIQRILRRHGGRAWAQAAVEAGATFYFTL